MTKLAGVQVANLTTIPRHLIVTKCTVKSWTFNVLKQKSLRLQVFIQSKASSILHMHIKDIVLLLYCTQRTQLVAGSCICTLTHAAEPV